MTPERPAHPSIAQLREITQPAAIRGRGSAEHWTGDLYMRRLSPYVTRLLLPTGISANGVTWLMILSGWLAAAALLLPTLLGALLAAVLTQLQMMWDACDGEVARWRATSSPAGIFLDKFGHYTVETLIALALGIRAGGGPRHLRHELGWLVLGALLAWLMCLNKALNDMVHSSRAGAGLPPLPDIAKVRTPRVNVLARVRQALRVVPFHRIYHSIEFTLIILVAAVVDRVRTDLDATRVLLAVVVPLALLAVVGHFLAIVTSNRLRPA